MAIRLSEPAIQELSLVFGTYKGKEYAPRNEEALVLAVKGGERKPSFLNRLITKLKAGFPVSVDVEDNVDHDGDGADDYNALCGMLSSAFGDLQQAMGIQDDEARAAAICAVLDGFKEDYDAAYAGKADKAGARHSAADRESLNSISEAHQHMSAMQMQMSDHMAKIGAALQQLGLNSEMDAGEESEQPEDDDKNPGVEDKAAEVDEKAKRTDEAGKRGDEYGDVEYADTANKKYPIDTEEHVRAAWSYINMPKNEKFYDAQDLAKVKDRIRAAAKKFGIEISDEKAGELDMTQEELDAKIAEAAAKAAAKAAEDTAAAMMAKLQPQIDAAKAEAAASAQKAAEAEKALVSEARRPSAASGAKVENVEIIGYDGGIPIRKARPALVAAVKAQLGANPEPTRF